MAEIRRPPILRLGHQRDDVSFDCRQIERLEPRGIIEGFAHRIGLRRVLVEYREIELIRPPQPVGHLEENGFTVYFAAVHGALGFSVHGVLRLLCASCLCEGKSTSALTLSNHLNLSD
jgi:hypothetical protein